MQRKISQSPYWFITPAMLVLVMVIVIPLLYALFLSLQHTQGLIRRWVGLGNYIDILTHRFFWEASARTAYFTVVSVALEFVIGMLVALLLHQEFKWRGLARAVMILPWALPTVVNGVLWSWIFNANYGSLNALLKQFGFIKTYVPWLGTSFSAMNSVILADVWKNFPMMSLILLAGMQTIPKSFYESSMIDGANAFQRFFRITVPVLKPSILACLVMRTMEAFKVFDIVYTMTKGGPANGTQVISYYTYQTSFQYSRFGYGAALSYLVSFIIFMMAMVYIKLLSTKD